MPKTDYSSWSKDAVDNQGPRRSLRRPRAFPGNPLSPSQYEGDQTHGLPQRKIPVLLTIAGNPARITLTEGA